jgi:hypothetical protein
MDGYNDVDFLALPEGYSDPERIFEVVRNTLAGSASNTR